MVHVKYSNLKFAKIENDDLEKVRETETEAEIETEAEAEAEAEAETATDRERRREWVREEGQIDRE
jgi:hypothetical protein